AWRPVRRDSAIPFRATRGAPRRRPRWHRPTARMGRSASARRPVVAPRDRGRGGLPMSTRTHGSERDSPPATVSQVAERRLKHGGWGYEDEQPSHEEVPQAAAFIPDRLGFGSTEPERPVALAEIVLPAPRISPPRALEEICRSDTHDRA